MNVIFDGHNSLHRYDSVMPPEIEDVASAIFKKYWKKIKTGITPILLLDPISPEKEYSPRLLKSRSTLETLFIQLGFRVVIGKDKAVGAIIGEAPSEDFLIESNDKDFCQLVSDKVNLLKYADGEYAIYGRDYVIKKWGVTPEQFADYLCLAGDATDGIKGVPKVGPKTAVKFLKEHGSLLQFTLAILRSEKNTPTAEGFTAEYSIGGRPLTPTEKAVLGELHDGSIAKKVEEVVISLNPDSNLQSTHLQPCYNEAMRTLRWMGLTDISAYYFCKG